MKKKIVSLILLITLVITSCSNKVDTPLEEDPGPIEDKYELIALNSHRQGIDQSTVFQLTGKLDMDKSFIEKNLQIIPNQEYRVEEISKTVHNIIPLSNLENDKVYQVLINDDDYDYSWAFQTEKKFEIESTIPENKSSYVPANSGIEIYFTLGNMEELDSYFEIEPHVEGKFIYQDRTAIFVPDQLEENINYTLTIKKGLGLKDSEQKLEEDYVFTFNTKLERYDQLYFDSPLTNIYEGNKKIIQAYTKDQDENIEYNINIYQYKDSDSFGKNIKYYADRGKLVSDENSLEDIDGLVKINAVNQTPFISNRSYGYGPKALFELPELDKGYYLLEFITEDTDKTYHFLQINDMLVYNAFFENEILVFVADGENSKGIVDAGVTINGEDLGFTDENGMLAVSKDTSIYEKETISMKIESKGYNDFIYADSFYFYSYYYRAQNDAYKYLRYIDTDRSTYLPTDTIRVWGFARHKDHRSLNQVKIELVEANTNLILEEKPLNLTDIGTYQAEFQINNITAENCIINVYDGDIKISAKYISIGKYTKPLYRLKGEFNKEFVYSGEELNYKINANFFDGYPLPNMGINYRTFYYDHSGTTIYETVDSSVKLSEEGEAIIDVKTHMVSDGWRPVTIHMNSWNEGAEDKAIHISDWFEIFPKDKMLEVEENSSNPDTIDILFHELDNRKYNTDDYRGYEDLRGKALSGNIALEIMESYYEKTKKGEYYDFINKVNVIEYEYNLISNWIHGEDVNLTEGSASLKIPNFNPERSYRVNAYYEDGEGGIREEVYISGHPRYRERLYYSLEKTDEKERYRLNDSINLQLKYDYENVENIQDDKLVLLFMKNGLIDYMATDNTNPSLTFKEDYISNVMINSLYIKNGYMYPVEFNGSLYYDRSEKEIHFDIVTDKEKYRPGEEVLLNIRARDENNQPCIADVNISVVDEAYFALFPKNVDTLSLLYETSWRNGLNSVYLSNIDLSIDEGSGAEMGGGGGHDGSFRDEFKDTNFFETVTTDREGKASLKFKLADNLTSWRITYQGISDKQYAGSGTKNISVSLPFFVDLIMGKEYLKEDKVSASLRVFGSQAKESQEVEYQVTIKDKESGKELKYSQTGTIGDYSNIFFDRLDEEQYEIYVNASYKDYQDGIKEEFAVVDSSVYFNNTDYYKLSETTVLEEVHSNPVITLFNESSSDFYKSLNDIANSRGKRIDQGVSSLLAAKYINEYFKSDIYFNEEELLEEINKYEVSGGGLSLFTYSGGDAELTAKMINTIEDEYLNAKAKKYFRGILDSNAEYTTDIAAALWGLAKYREPVLLTVYDLLENDSLEGKDKIYLALALAELGDKNTAKKHYKELTNNLKEWSGNLYFQVEGGDSTKDYELTALMSLLAVKLGDFDTGDKLFQYIYNNPSKYTLSNMEQLIYIMNRDIMQLDEIKDLFGEVTVTIDGKASNYQLKLFHRESFAVPKDKIKDVKFSKIKGSIACKVEALGNKEDLEKNKSDEFSMDIAYTSQDSTEERMEYSHSDIVKVTIMPSFSDQVERGNYQITYIVPAGFRFIGIDRSNPFWLDEDGQKLRFNFYYDRENFAAIPIAFYMQAAQTGEYTVDYVVMKENLETKLNYLNKETLKVKSIE